jgi:hypothetical protein
MSTSAERRQNAGTPTYNGCQTSPSGSNPLDCSLPASLSLTTTANAVVNSGSVITSKGGIAQLFHRETYALVNTGGTIIVNNVRAFTSVESVLTPRAVLLHPRRLELERRRDAAPYQAGPAPNAHHQLGRHRHLWDERAGP